MQPVMLNESRRSILGLRVEAADAEVLVLGRSGELDSGDSMQGVLDDIVIN
jgi:hypothetical protein